MKQLTYSEIKALLTRQDNYDAVNAGILNGQALFPAGDPRQIPIDLQIYEYLKERGDPRFVNTEYIKNPLPQPNPEPIPDTGEEEMPTFLVKSTISDGPKGNINFTQDNESTPNIIATGIIYPESYNIDETTTLPEINTVSTDFNFLALGNEIVNDWNKQIKSGGYLSKLGKLSIVKTITEIPENFREYSLRGKVVGEINQGLPDVYITDDLKSQQLPSANCYSEPDGSFLLEGYYVVNTPTTGNIIKIIDHKVVSGESVSKIALKYPQKGLDGKDIPFYPERSMQIYNANPIMKGRSTPIKSNVDKSYYTRINKDYQVLEEENLIFAGETIKIPFFDYTEKPQMFKLTFSKEGYTSKSKNPWTKTTTNISILPPNMGNIKLQTSILPKKLIIEQIPIPDFEIQVIEVKEKLKDPFGFFNDELLQSILKMLKTKLLPYILQRLLDFGISNAKEALLDKAEGIDIKCPADLNKIINAVNKLTKSLNNTYERLEQIKVGVQFVDQGITIAQVVAQTLSALVLAFPTIPFAPDPLKPITEKIPQPTGKIKSVIETISDLLEKLKIFSASTLLILTLLINTLQEILNYLGLLNMLIQKCASNSDSILNDQIQLDDNLLALTQQQSNQGSPVVTNVNGFEMGVLNVQDSNKNQLGRRQAIARNKAGVIMLKGEPSFASNDQILIDQLVYYIKTNDLKAD